MQSVSPMPVNGARAAIATVALVCLAAASLGGCSIDDAPPAFAEQAQHSQVQTTAHPSPIRTCEDIFDEIFLSASGCVQQSDYEYVCTCVYMVSKTDRFWGVDPDIGRLVCVTGETTREPDVTRDCILTNPDLSLDPLPPASSGQQ